MFKIIVVALILLTIPSCAAFNDPNDQIIQDECDLKNSVPNIHDIIDWGDYMKIKTHVMKTSTGYCDKYIVAADYLPYVAEISDPEALILQSWSVVSEIMQKIAIESICL